MGSRSCCDRGHGSGGYASLQPYIIHNRLTPSDRTERKQLVGQAFKGVRIWCLGIFVKSKMQYGRPLEFLPPRRPPWASRHIPRYSHGVEQTDDKAEHHAGDGGHVHGAEPRIQAISRRRRQSKLQTDGGDPRGQVESHPERGTRILLIDHARLQSPGDLPSDCAVRALGNHPDRRIGDTGQGSSQRKKLILLGYPMSTTQ